jgi:hypothetical protein
MAGRSIGASGRKAIDRIASGAAKVEFSSGQLRGQLERQDVNRVYLAVWEHGFHTR